MTIHGHLAEVTRRQCFSRPFSHDQDPLLTCDAPSCCGANAGRTPCSAGGITPILGWLSRREEMPVVFVSHTSKDDPAARGLEAWLRGHGFTDFFVDHTSIAGGEKWAQALRDASGACRVVICLVTERWLASDECFGEFKAAWYMGKRIIPLLALAPGKTAAGDRLANVLTEDQGFEIGHCMDADGGLDLSRAQRGQLYGSHASHRTGDG